MNKLATDDEDRTTYPVGLGRVVGGRWQLGELLGAGGMALVYEAHHRNGKRVAIKMLRPELAHNNDALGRFWREGYLANAVDHPGAVSVLDDGMTDDGVPFLVMEYLEGENLEDRLERLGKSLALPDVLAIGVALLDTLEAAARSAIVHRDLKPDNVFLCADGAVKILDFGIARLNDASGSRTPTLLGSALGTPSFMAREQALGRGDQLDGQTDLWALGATLVYALTRQCIYEAPTVNALLVEIATKDPPPVRTLAPLLPAPIAQVLDRALFPDRPRRWRTAADMKKALLDAAREAGVAIPRRPATAGYVRAPSRRPSLVESLSALAIHKPEAAPSSEPPAALGSVPPRPSALPAPRINRAAIVISSLAMVALVLLARLRPEVSAPLGDAPRSIEATHVGASPAIHLAPDPSPADPVSTSTPARAVTAPTEATPAPMPPDVIPSATASTSSSSASVAISALPRAAEAPRPPEARPERKPAVSDPRKDIGASRR